MKHQVRDFNCDAIEYLVSKDEWLFVIFNGVIVTPCASVNPTIGPLWKSARGFVIWACWLVAQHEDKLTFQSSRESIALYRSNFFFLIQPKEVHPFLKNGVKEAVIYKVFKKRGKNIKKRVSKMGGVSRGNKLVSRTLLLLFFLSSLFLRIFKISIRM